MTSQSQPAKKTLTFYRQGMPTKPAESSNMSKSNAVESNEVHQLVNQAMWLGVEAAKLALYRLEPVAPDEATPDQYELDRYVQSALCHIRAIEALLESIPERDAQHILELVEVTRDALDWPTIDLAGQAESHRVNG